MEKHGGEQVEVAITPINDDAATSQQYSYTPPSWNDYFYMPNILRAMNAEAATTQQCYSSTVDFFYRDHTVLAKSQHDSSTTTPSQQSFGIYFYFLYITLGAVFMGLQGRLRFEIINKNQSPFEINSLFMITSIVALSVAVIASGVMVLTNYRLVKTSSVMKNKDIYYTILKFMGCYSAVLAPFSLGMVLYAPRNMSNWPIWYPFPCIFVFLIVCGIYFGIAGLIRELPPLRENTDDDKSFKVRVDVLVPVSLVLVFLVPVSLLLVLLVPNNLNWVAFSAFNLFYLIMLLWLVILYVAYAYDPSKKTTQPPSISKLEATTI